jgi:uncharacterized repeat protein (TIGR03943 family)
LTGRTQAVILLLFGAVLVRLAGSDALLRYVRPEARVPVGCAGFGIAALGCLAGGRRPRRARDGHAHGTASQLAWVVLAPIIAVAVIAPPALGAMSANRQPTVPPDPGRPFTALGGVDPVPIKLVDIVLRAVWDDGRTLRGHTLRVVGFVSRGTADGFVLARLVITCCAADAEPYDLEIRSTRVAAAPRGQWVEVTGRFAGMSASNHVVPVLTATGWRAVPPPVNPYD